MERNREGRRSTMAASANGLSRRRHRSSSLRDSPEEDGFVELQETARLRDRGVKKERDRDRSGRSKRRRGDRSSREDGGEESSEESVNDEEDEYDDEGGGGGGGGVRMLPSNPIPSISSSLSEKFSSNHHHNHHRKSFPPSAAAKVLRPVSGWKPADEMIGFSVPRKARSASTKRPQECSISGSGVGAEPINRQTSTSPARPSPSPAPVSPFSSNASARKKMKQNGPKLRPPKSSSSNNPEDLEIEIAEVLYGMKTQSQTSSKKEIMREGNKSMSNDAKSRVSSPISNSASTAPQNSSSSATPFSAAVAPKRKRPRQIVDNNPSSFSVRPNPISSTMVAKVEIDNPPKTEIPAENGSVPLDFAASQAVVPPPSEAPPPPPETGGESQAVDPAKVEEAVTPLKEESAVVRPDDDRDVVTAIKANSKGPEIESQREEKFEIDLMAPPPQMRSSPERGGEIDFVVAVKDEEKAVERGKDEAMNNAEPEQKKVKMTLEEAEFEKPVVVKERNIDLQIDLENLERGVGNGGGIIGNKLNPQVQKQQQHQLQKATKDEPPHTEKIAQTSSMPLPMSVASWPGGLPPMGYMTPLQGVVSMDGNTVSPSPIQPLFSHPRPKRCATHCYIARNIHYLQQFMKMNPFWPSAAGSPSLFGAKPPCNLNVDPLAELQGNNVQRSLNSMQDKGQGLAIFPGYSGKDKGSQAANIAADTQRKQQQPIMLQHTLPHSAPPSNILHGPAFIFPLNQQHAAAAAVAAASIRPGSVVSPPTAAGNAASSNASSSVSVSGSATAPPTVSFNYPNMPSSETQYLAILQNNAYPFPIPSVGAPPTYRGAHAQPMSFFNGPFYSSQMIHPSQLQQQQPSTQQQHTSTSNGSSSSQKHLQSQQQQRPQNSGTYGGNGSGNLHGFPAPKKANQHLPMSHQALHLENEVGGEDSPSTADSRVSRPPMSVYGQNFAVPIHPHNFSLMTPPPSALGGAASGGGNQGEKIQQQQQQQQQKQGLKAAGGGVESLPPQAFAMSFGSMNGVSTSHGLDISSMAQNHAVLRSLPEATRHSYQIIATANAAHAAQQKKNPRVFEEVKNGSGGDSSNNVDEEKKSSAGKSIVFSRPDLTDPSTVAATTVVDASARTMNPVSASTRNSRTAMQDVMQFQQQQLMLVHKPNQQQLAALKRTPSTSNGSVYNDAKFSNGISASPQNFVQNSSSSSPAQSTQWKNSARSISSQVPSSLTPSTTSSSSSSLKNLPQQHTRAQQNHTQISFGASQKPSTTAPQQGQQAANSHQAPSPPMAVGSPTTSSLSKGAGGSPRTTTSSTSAANKPTKPSSLSSQPAKNSASVPSRKSSPVGGANVQSILGNSPISSSSKPQIQQQQLQLQSILGNSHILSSSNTSAKSQTQQQIHQQHQLHQQIQLQQMHQQQLLLSRPHMQAQAPHCTGSIPAGSITSGYYLQRGRSEHQQSQQPPQGSSATSSTGMMSLCPTVSVSNTSTSDAKAAATAASNTKGGGLSAQGILHSSSGNKTHPLVPPGFSIVHPLASPVQVKPAEQKQPAGNGDCLTRK